MTTSLSESPFIGMRSQFVTPPGESNRMNIERSCGVKQFSPVVSIAPSLLSVADTAVDIKELPRSDYDAIKTIISSEDTSDNVTGDCVTNSPYFICDDKRCNCRQQR